MKIDTHLHTTRISACSKMTSEEAIYSAKRKGLDGMIVLLAYSLNN